MCIHRRIRVSWVLIFTLPLVIACDDLDLTPENAFTDESFWTNDDKALSFLNTAYSQLYTSTEYFYNEALSDNAYAPPPGGLQVGAIAAGIHDPSLGRFQGEWNSRYAGIKTTNLFLDNVDRVPGMDEGLRARTKAEARFLRAWQHFMLTTWFGDVPLLRTDPTIEEAQTLVRASAEEVQSFVISELTEVAAQLPTVDEYPEADRGRVTRGAATALLARVHLYAGNWAEVERLSQEIIDGRVGGYGLFPSYSGLFLPQNEYSQEDILSIQYVPEFRMYGDYFDIAPISAGARLNALAPTQSLVESYVMQNGLPINDPQSGYDENDIAAGRDPRLKATVVYHNYEWEDADGSTHVIYIEPGSDPDIPLDEYAPGSSKTWTGYYTRKNFDPTHRIGLASGMNLSLIRYADVLLMYAEARNELGNFDNATWDATVRALRQRAGFPGGAGIDYPITDQGGYREIIRNERRSELAMEGLRIFDIRRWRTAEAVLNGVVRGARYGPPSVEDGYIQVDRRTFNPDRHYLWPVPRDEVLINPNLGQNPGW